MAPRFLTMAATDHSESPHASLKLMWLLLSSHVVCVQKSKWKATVICKSMACGTVDGNYCAWYMLAALCGGRDEHTAENNNVFCICCRHFPPRVINTREVLRIICGHHFHRNGPSRGHRSPNSLLWVCWVSQVFTGSSLSKNHYISQCALGHLTRRWPAPRDCSVEEAEQPRDKNTVAYFAWKALLVPRWSKSWHTQPTMSAKISTSVRVSWKPAVWEKWRQTTQT